MKQLSSVVLTVRLGERRYRAGARDEVGQRNILVGSVVHISDTYVWKTSH